MALNVVLVTQKQGSKGTFLSWNAMEGVASYLVFVATRKLTPEELEAAVLLGGTDECLVAKLGADATAVVDDCSPEGETRFYGVGMSFSDGAPRSARFKAAPDAAPPGTPTLSSKGAKKSKAPSPSASARPAAPAAANPAPSGPTGSHQVPAAGTPGAKLFPSANPSPARPAANPSPGSAAPTGNTGAYRVGSPPAGSSAPTGNTGAYRVAASPAAAAAPAPAAPRPAAEARAEKPIEKPAEKPVEKAPAAARPAREPASLADETVAPPSDFPLEESFSFHMSGGTQTWDGLRLYWERETTAAAYEILVSDHQIFGDELADALAGKADFTSCTAVPPSVRAVLDNITPREARGWYLVLVRAKNGTRTPHPFQIGDAAESGKAVAPFVNPNRTGELRAEVEGMLGEAREQWARWKSEQDGGARREAKRLVADALLIYPNHPGATELLAELE